MYRYILKTLLLLVFPFLGFSQTVEIYGKNTAYIGEELVFCTYSDFITQYPDTLAITQVNASGEFKTSFKVDKTTLVYITKGINKGFLFVEPGRKYEMALPPFVKKRTEDYLNPYFKEHELIMGVTNNKPEDLNNLIINFDADYKEFLANEFTKILVGRFNKNLVDSVCKVFSQNHPDHNNNYFKIYKDYKLKFIKFMSYQRNETYAIKEYFRKKEIYYYNDGYMFLFNKVFDNFFSYFYSTSFGENLPITITKSKSPVAIKKELQNNPALYEQEQLMELMILKGINDEIFEGNYSERTLIQILDSIEIKTEIPHHKIIAQNIKKKSYRLKRGMPAPDFDLPDANGNMYNLGYLKQNFIYLNFIMPGAYTVEEDLDLLAKLHEDGKSVDLQIMSIVVSDDIREVQKLQNKYPWKFLWYNYNDQLVKEYDVRIFPSYFLIDKEGRIIKAPAPTPQEDFKYYFFNVFLDIRRDDIRSEYKKSENKHEGFFQRVFGKN